MLACMVGVLVAIDLLFMIVTLSVPQLMVKAAIVPNQENPISEVGVSSAACYMQLMYLVLHFMYLHSTSTYQMIFQFFQRKIMNTILVCQSIPKRSFEIWRIILITYKVLVQISAVPLAFAIRKVKTKGLNDSKNLVSIVYITSISLAVTIVCFAALYEKVNTSAAIYSLGAWVTSTVILCFMFIPKVSSKPMCFFIRNCHNFTSSSKCCSPTRNCIFLLLGHHLFCKQSIYGA